MRSDRSRKKNAPERERSAARAEKDLERWLPLLFEKALGRAPRRPGALSADELHAAGRAVRALSRGFTGERALAGAPYLNDRSSLAAYLLYFWPVSYLQARAFFRRLLPPGILAKSDVLDAGAGPGPLAAAALDAGARRVLAVDADRKAAALAAGLARGRGYALSSGRWDMERSAPPAGRFKLILLGHALNELWPGRPDGVERRARVVRSLADRLEEGGLIVILEPALLRTSRELLALRGLLTAEGFPVLSPCLRQGPCPCLADGTSTCHADFAWQPPPYLRLLAHRARLGKESLRFSCLALGRPGSAPPSLAAPDVFRVVSERMLNKSGRFRYFICSERGRFTLSAKPRGGEPWRDLFLRLRRYDAVRVVNAEDRENGIGLAPQSVLERVSVWGE